MGHHNLLRHHLGSSAYAVFEALRQFAGDRCRPAELRLAPLPPTRSARLEPGKEPVGFLLEREY